jgi:hypothetical protein
MGVCPPRTISRSLAALKASPATGKAEAHFVLTTDGMMCAVGARGFIYIADVRGASACWLAVDRKPLDGGHRAIVHKRSMKQVARVRCRVGCERHKPSIRFLSRLLCKSVKTGGSEMY